MSRIPREKVSEIESVSGGKARLAIDLISYDERVEVAMQQVFGRMFICDDQQTAKKISSMPNGFDCVTRQGDKYDRSGTLHGGFQSQGEILKKVQEYMEKDKLRRDKAKEIF